MSQQANHRILALLVSAVIIIGILQRLFISQGWNPISSRTVTSRPLSLPNWNESTYKLGDFDWSSNSRHENLITLGSPPVQIELDDGDIINVLSGQPLYTNDQHTFNLALLKLPSGSEWDFFGVARGPSRLSAFMMINDSPIREQFLVASVLVPRRSIYRGTKLIEWDRMGLNLSELDGRLHTVSRPTTLDIKALPDSDCRAEGF